MRSQTLCLVLLLPLLACGGGSSSSGGGTGSGGLGGGPPEDIFDLPNTLPDDFILASCPPITGYISHNDLSVVLTSPDATSFDFDGDGDPDSLVTQFNAAAPKTFILEANALGATAFPPSIIDGVLTPSVVGGRVFDETGAPLNANSYGDNLDPNVHWVAPYRRPILSYTLFGGIEFFMDPGIHVFTVYFADLNLITHCASESYRIIMCPADGDPIPSFLSSACPPPA